MVTSGSSNDVKIVLEDGEIFANKDVLSARSDYFATMFSSKNEFKFIVVIVYYTSGLSSTVVVVCECIYIVRTFFR